MKFKETSFGMLLVLTVTAILVGAVLAFAYQMFYPRIEANRIAEEKRAIFAVLDGAASYDIIEREIDGKKGKETIKIFKGLNAAGGHVGYAFIAEGPGFQAKIKMMVGLNFEFKKLLGMKVLEQLETPGLGNKIVEDKFTDQFSGLAFTPKIEYLKNKKPEKDNEIQAITGATISSKAVVEAINNSIKAVIDIIEEESKE
ncbi:MAG: RnfABCDGE type electron transport complex subunit G [Proteobacteria bacterium]|nr:RnfABCDGE type electron transport complex subunit G [Pseudomonadota bacterium]